MEQMEGGIDVPLKRKSCIWVGHPEGIPAIAIPYKIFPEDIIDYYDHGGLLSFITVYNLSTYFFLPDVRKRM